MNPHLVKSLHEKLTKSEVAELKQSFQFVTGLYAEDVNEYIPEPTISKRKVNKWICLYENTPLTHIFTNRSDAIDYSKAYEDSGQGIRLAVVKVTIEYANGDGLDA